MRNEIIRCRISFLLFLIPPIILEAQELRLSNISIAENHPTGKVVATIEGVAPEAFLYLPGIREVGAGENHTLLIMGDGSLWGMGSNYYYGLGSSDKKYPKGHWEKMTYLPYLDSSQCKY